MQVLLFLRLGEVLIMELLNVHKEGTVLLKVLYAVVFKHQGEFISKPVIKLGHRFEYQVSSE